MPHILLFVFFEFGVHSARGARAVIPYTRGPFVAKDYLAELLTEIPKKTFHVSHDV